MLARLPVSDPRGSLRLRLGRLRTGAVKVGYRSVFAICATHVHPRAPGVVNGYFRSGQERPTNPWCRIMGFDQVRASLGNIIEDLLVMCFRELVAGLRLRAEKIREVERQLVQLFDAMLDTL